MRILSLIILIFVIASDKVNSCAPYLVPPITSQTLVGSNLILQWQSATAWACIYNVYVEIRCASNPGGSPVLTSLSGCVNKPTAALITYPTTHIIDISSLCPGETYIFRGKETPCGTSSGGSSWTSDFTFVAGGVNAFSVTASADVSICLGSCATLTSFAVNTCNPSITYSWDNGGGSDSTANVCPTTTTTYTVTASTTTTCGAISTTETVTVTVELPPVGGTTVANPDHICLGDSTTVSISGEIGAIQWQTSLSPTGPWTNIGVGDTNSFVTPAIFGDLYYQASISNVCGSALSSVVQVYGEPFPVMNFTLSDICIYETVQFINTTTIPSGSVTNWNWDFGDVNTSTAQNPSHQYASTGTYTVNLQATSDYGCIDSVSKQITVSPKPVADFTTMDVCMYTAAQFADNSSVASGTITGWIWDFDDISTSTTQNPSHQYNSFGVFNVSLVVFTDQGCRDTSIQALEIFAVPTASFTATTVCLNTPPTQFTNNSTIGDGTQLIYAWDFDDGITSTVENPMNMYLDSGIYSVDLIVTSSNLCVDSITVPVEVYSIPDVNFVADTTFGCAPLTVNFTNTTTNAVSYDWDLGDGAFPSSFEPSHVYEDPGAITSYTISLTATSSNGCVVNYSRFNYITIWPNPIADFWAGPNPAAILYPYMEFQNLSSGDSTAPTTYTWDFGDSSSYIGWDTLHVYDNQDTGTYIVALLVVNGYGCADSAYDTIVIKYDYILFAPNAFTPNGDGINDTFFPQGIGLNDPAFKFEFVIMNRWGDVIFKTDDIAKRWDGKGNGGRKLAQEDVYIWMINTQDVTLNIQKHKYVGHVTLLK